MASQAEVIALMTMEDVPVKLRCAACNQLVLEAYKMACCDQSICEECQVNLPQSCPVCLHEPANKDDCRPNKALRITVKAFLKRKIVEADMAKKKELAAKAQAENAEAAKPTERTPVAEPIQPATASEPSQTKLDIAAPESETPQAQDLASAAKTASPSKQTLPEGGQEALENPAQTAQFEVQQSKNPSNGNQPDLVNGTTAEPKKPQQRQQDPTGANNFMNGDTFQNMNNMSNMGFSQMMQFMPNMPNGMANGMPNNMMGPISNMMGMPGMVMDPMAMSQGFFGNMGGPGMGMNGMGMGMGFDAGQNAMGGFSGQSQGQGPYGHMGGSYGANGGFGGFNMPQQGNFNQMHQQNFNHDFSHGPQQGFQYRGRGRGRGNFAFAGRGRGFPQALSNRHTYNEGFQGQSDQPVRRGSPDYGPNRAEPSTAQNSNEVVTEDAETQKIIEEQLRKEFAPGDAEDETRPAKQAEKSEGPTKTDPSAVEAAKLPVATESNAQAQRPDAHDSVLLSPKTQGSDIQEKTKEVEVSQGAGFSSMRIPTGPASQRREVPSVISPSGPRGGRELSMSSNEQAANVAAAASPRESHSNVERNARPQPGIPSEPRGFAIQGVPTGPKALRQGLPNTSMRPVPESGFTIVGRASTASIAQQIPVNGALEPKSPPKRSRSHTRSRSPPRRTSETQKRQRSRSASPSREKVRDRRYDRRDYPDRDEEDYGDRNKRTFDRDRGAELSPVRRSDHRSSRNMEKESSKSKHRSHRSHRDRSRSHDRDHRSRRKRSESPEFHISGASKVKTVPIINGTSRRHDEGDSGHSSRKRRDRDTADDEHHHSERKRSRRNDDDDIPSHREDRSSKHRSAVNGESHRRDERTAERQSSSRHLRRESSRASRPAHESAREDDSPAEAPKVKVDQHALEREARNRERQMKEIQRRALMEGPSSSRTKGQRPGERKHSFKYEDERADLATRTEREREGGRWR